MVLLASTYDQSKFLRAEDLTQDKTFRIKSVSEELVGQGADQQKKLVVWFTNSPKGLALNRTNNRTIRGAYGDDTAGWTGALRPTTADAWSMRCGCGSHRPGNRQDRQSQKASTALLRHRNRLLCERQPNRRRRFCRRKRISI
jgi:hypothetical protein